MTDDKGTNRQEKKKGRTGEIERRRTIKEGARFGLRWRGWRWQGYEFILGGFETSSFHQGTAVYLMARYPDKTAKLFQVCAPPPAPCSD